MAIVVFAVVGRANHDESTGAHGVWHTAWPFLLGAALGLAATAYAAKVTNVMAMNTAERPAIRVRVLGEPAGTN